MELKEIKLDYRNLPSTLMINLSNNLRKKIFNRLDFKFKDPFKISKCLGCCISSLKYYRRGEHFIPVNIFNRVISLCNFNAEELNSSITHIKKRLCGRPIKIVLPIKPSSCLAALIGHSLGDGHVSRGGRFVYVNKEKELIKKVKLLVNKTFRNNVYVYEKFKDQKYTRIYYPSAVGEILEFFGSVKGSKTNQAFKIPEWIETGNNKIKSAFLRAIFDDEGTVSKTRIALNMSKITEKRDSLVSLLESFKELLSDLGVNSSRTVLSNKHTSKKGIKTVNLVFIISGYQNLKTFYKNIGFYHSKKQEKLRNLLFSYTRPPGETRREILELLKNKSHSTHDLMRLLNKTKSGVKYNLKILENQGKLKRIVINKRKHIWAKNE